MQRVADAVALGVALSSDGETERLAVAIAVANGGRVRSVSDDGSLVTVEAELARIAIVLPRRLGGRRIGIDVTAKATAARIGETIGNQSAPPPAAIARFVSVAAAREGVPAPLLIAQLRAESDFNAGSVSSAGAQGIAQFMPGTWSGEWNPWRMSSPFDPEPAINAQARLMRNLLAWARGDVRRALAGYNAGQGGAAGPESTWPGETQAYVGRIAAEISRGSTAATTPRIESPQDPAPVARLVR